MGKLLFLLMVIIAGNSYGIAIKSKEVRSSDRKERKGLITHIIRKDLNAKAPVKIIKLDLKPGKEPLKKGIPVVGRSIETNIRLSDMLCNNNVCIIKIRLEDAKAGKVHLNRVRLRRGEYIIVRSFAGDVIYKYGYRSFSKRYSLWSGIIPYRDIYIEYHYKGPPPTGTFVIDKVSYIWDLPYKRQQPPDPIDNPPCNAKDAVCCDGQTCFQPFKEAVALYLFTGKDGFEYICSGTLVANKALNHDPLFLTARHCISTQQEAESATFWFKYYNSTCNPIDSDAKRNAVFVPHATLLHAHFEGDTSLLRIDGSLKIDHNDYFLAGVLFNEIINIQSSVFGFSHPAGNSLIYHAGTLTGRCISDFLLPEAKACDLFLPYNSFRTEWKEGGTAGGSSGSCLFYQKGPEWYCIGTLSFGDPPSYQCPPQIDYYADLSFFYNTSLTVISIFEYGLRDDIYEDNDTLQSATSLQFNCGDSLNIPSLIVKDMDPDFFAIPVKKGCTLDINVSFKHIWGDIDITLFDPSGSVLANSNTINDFEIVKYTAIKNETVILNVNLVDDTFQEYMIDIVSSYENEPPTCTAIINDDARYTNSTTVSVNIQVQDNVFSPSELEICVYEFGSACNGWKSFSSPHTLQLSNTEGEKAVVVEVRDPAGNQSSCQDTIALDTTPPAGGTISAIRTDLDQITVSWNSFTDNLSGISHYILVYDTTAPPTNCNEGTIIFQGNQTSFVHENIVPGNIYYYRVCAVDMAHNISSGVSVFINIDNAPPVINSFTATPTEGFAPLTVKFSWDISDKENDPLFCEIDIGDNGLVDVAINNCMPPSYSFTFVNSGNYPVRLIVSDSANNRTEAIVNVSVNDLKPVNKPPFISYLDVYPTEGMAPLKVRVGFSVGDPDKDSLKCLIDFNGDGKYEFNKDDCSSGNAVHIYKAKGYYTLVFMVVDTVGNKEIKEAPINVIGDDIPLDKEKEEKDMLRIFGCNQGIGSLYWMFILVSILSARRLKLIN